MYKSSKISEKFRFSFLNTIYLKKNRAYAKHAQLKKGILSLRAKHQLTKNSLLQKKRKEKKTF